MISQANTTKSPPYGSFFRKHCWYLRFKSADALTSDLDELNIHHELLHLSSAILVKGSLAVWILLGTMKWHLTKAWAQENRERSIWEGRVQEYWPKLVFKLKTNTQTEIKLITLLKDGNSYLTRLMLISMDERIIQQKVNGFCWEKHTSHHFHIGSLVKQNWRPHEMSQLFIFHLGCKLDFINHLHTLIFQIASPS